VIGQRGGGATVQVVDFQTLQDALGESADLLARAIVDLQPPGTAADVNPSPAQGDLGAVDALMPVANDAQRIAVSFAERTDGADQSQGFQAEVLDLIDQNVGELLELAGLGSQSGFVDRSLEGQQVAFLQPR